MRNAGAWTSEHHRTPGDYSFNYRAAAPATTRKEQEKEMVRGNKRIPCKESFNKLVFRATRYC